MKKWILLWMLVLVMVIGPVAFARQYQTTELIPVSDSATIETDRFTYTEFRYLSQVEGKEYGRFQFESITNKTDKSAYVGIDILLFDADQKNIGFVAYCTGEDVESDYAQKKLAVGSSMPFFINVSKRYLVDDKTPADVAYFAVLDDNEYCHVGGRDKYSGLTLTEIVSGKVVTEEGEKQTVDIENLINFSSLGLIVGIIVGVILLFVVQGLILNALYKRMYATTTALAYLPIACNYVTVKMAFGGGVAKFYIIAYFITFGLSFVGLGIFSIILSCVAGFAFLIVLIKLITKKYDLFYMEPFENNRNVATGGGFTLNKDAVKAEDVNATQTSGLTSPILGDTDDTETNGEEVLDLNYSTSMPINGFADPDAGSDTFDYNASDMNGVDNGSSGEDTPKQADGNSDLMNLFK